MNCGEKKNEWLVPFTRVHVWITNSSFLLAVIPVVAGTGNVGLSKTATLGFRVAVCKKFGILNLQTCLWHLASMVISIA